MQHVPMYDYHTVLLLPQHPRAPVVGIGFLTHRTYTGHQCLPVHSFSSRAQNKQVRSIVHDCFLPSKVQPSARWPVGDTGGMESIEGA